MERSRTGIQVRGNHSSVPASVRGGEFSANSGGGRKRKATKEKQVLDLEALCGGKVELKKDVSLRSVLMPAPVSNTDFGTFLFL